MTATVSSSPADEAAASPTSRSAFHRLTVAAVDRLTDDSAAITFSVPSELAEQFVFAPGQSLTVKVGEERRSYSICARTGRPPRIGVREVAGGAVSGVLVRTIKPGDVLEVQVPTGTFTPDLTGPGRHVLIAAGSGITPMMSIASSVLAAHPESAVTLIYGNRRTDSVMFADEIADLKDEFTSRMMLVHVLSREPQEVELFSGRLDADRLRRLLPVVTDVAAVDHFWLCGPFGMVQDAISVLTELGVDRSRIHRELFYVGDDPPLEVHHVDAPAGLGSEVTAILDGRATTTAVPADEAILDGVQRVRPDLPFSCKGGVCGTCRAKVTRGEVRMRRNYALEEYEVAMGYVLTCQAVPISDQVTVDFDS